MTTLAAPLTAAPPVTQLALSLDVIVDAPTARERLDLLRELRGIHVGDVWASGEYRVERDDPDGVDTVRFMRGSHVRGEWAVTSANKLAAALRSIHAELVGTGITTGWLREGLLYDSDDESASQDECYDAFEAFIQEGLWRTHRETCSSSPSTSSCSGITRRSLARNTSSVISTGWRRSWTFTATLNTGATCGGSGSARSIRSTSGVTSAAAHARKATSRPTGIVTTGCTRSVRSAATATDVRITRQRRRSRARRCVPITGMMLKKSRRTSHRR